MSDRAKEIILKTILIISFIFLCMYFPGSLILSFLVPSEKFITLFMATTINIFFVFGITFMILLPIFWGLKPKPIKAERVPLLFFSYNELLYFLNKRLLEEGYKLQTNVCIRDDFEVTVYLKSINIGSLTCFTVVRIPSLSDETLDIANEKLTNILSEYYKNNNIKDTINMISVFCVDRISNEFVKLVNSNIVQGIKNGRLPIGISFGGKKIYIARQKDGFAIRKYKKLRKEFVRIMNFKDY